MTAILQPVQCQSRQGPGLVQGLVGFSITLEELPDVGVGTIRGSQLLSCHCYLPSVDGNLPP